MDDIHSVVIRDVKYRAEDWLKNNAPEPMWAEGASSSIMFAFLSQRMIRSLLSGTALAFLMIGIVLMLTLRSFKFGLLSLIPNMFPAAVTLGIWAVVVGIRL